MNEEKNLESSSSENCSTAFLSALCTVRRSICWLIWHRVAYTRRGMVCQRCGAREYTMEFINAGYLVRPLWAVQRFFCDFWRKLTCKYELPF